MQHKFICMTAAALLIGGIGSACAQQNGPQINSAPTAQTVPGGRDAKTIAPNSPQTQDPSINPNAAGTQYSGSSYGKTKDRDEPGKAR